MPKINRTMVLTATVLQAREDFCFYVQELLPTPDAEKGQVFYAGVCKLADVFRYPDAYKNTYWRATINDQSIIKTTVLATSDKINDMYHELAFFNRNIGRPTANAKGFQQSGTAMITCIEGPNAGKTYLTQERCAIENGISQPALSNHLNGRQGYQMVRGQRFKRGL